MKDTEEVPNKYLRPLVHSGLGGENKLMYVLVSHRELDNLVGRLMQMCELTGDQEQRKALKDEIKMRSREWLDDLYEQSGYNGWKPDPLARIIED